MTTKNVKKMQKEVDACRQPSRLSETLVEIRARTSWPTQSMNARNDKFLVLAWYCSDLVGAHLLLIITITSRSRETIHKLKKSLS